VKGCGAASCAAVAVAAAAVLSGCQAFQPRTTLPSDPDLVWVCHQHDLLTDFRGRITFEDVQRTLCYVGGHTAVRWDFAALASAARAEVQRRCDAGMTAADSEVSRPPSTIRQLYDVLQGIARIQLQAPGCSETAMITGMVRVLGDEYVFQPVGESPSDGADEAPAPSLINKSIVYVKFATLAGGQEIVEAALGATRADHAITGLILDLRGADGAPVDELLRFVDLFVDDGVVLEMRKRRTGEIERILATRRPAAEAAPLIVLVDGKTHSGAEAFAGALRASRRALLIGQRTSGRAITQTTIELPSGSLLVIPAGDLLEPGVGVISGRGVKPDIAFGPAGGPHEGGETDEVIRLAAQVVLAARSPIHADLLSAAQRILAARAAPR
jgi:hypothetical protein